ncbi:hypothetical protein HYQ45_018136 [Verticillium longisporum]|uniref:Gylcosyl hydrolase 115 C-terminal domain-containing protein n=1 Tax=Verticillium longisporum TaxID=100787 RepID=A0A8I2Z365_VERLO|nr:hypothetical protein HYQ45_018136 [Verticillium longisporum]RBQ89330.1 hypothetical protein VDGD_01547 [Verticillium dahliae]
MFETPIIGFDAAHGALDLAGLPVLFDKDEFEGTQIAIRNLARDLESVTGKPSALLTTTEGQSPVDGVILVGSLARCAFLRALGREGARRVRSLEGRWETFSTHVEDSPWAFARRVFVLAGSDKRGAIFASYTLTEQAGVSPWYWWADVPIKKHPHVYAVSEPTIHGEPSVKYRGIFINDEAPALTAWVHDKYGVNYGSEFYKRVFELLLRMKANFLWPAMWSGFPWPGSSFFTDDPLNQPLADTYGIVMSTSHHEPMQRDMTEWRTANKGVWSWETNKQAVAEHFETGIERAKPYESVITMGMRGEGDKKMIAEDPQGTLQDVLDSQREMIERVHGTPDGTPQLMALYKEALQMYEKGLKVPEDVTLLFADDNFGNVRRYPTEEERKRSGGAGLYYHLEYVGHPRSYKWLHCTSLGKVQQQLRAAHASGIDRVWVFNVGDIKPMEASSSFALSLAWNINSVDHSAIPSYFSTYALREFGPDHAQQIADVLAGHDRLVGLRRHEHIDTDTFSVVHNREAESIVQRWKALESQALKIFQAVPDAQKAAAYQLVLHPVKASRICTELRVTQALNQLYGLQRRNTTNVLAQRVLDLFQEDYDLEDEYHGNPWFGDKWNHIMCQPRYGYDPTTWHAPTRDMITGLSYVQTRRKSTRIAGQVGVAVQGHGGVRPGLANEECDRTHPSTGNLVPGFTLPKLSPYGPQSYYFEIFARGIEKIEWTVEPSESWIQASPASGTLLPDDKQDARVEVTINWDTAPKDFRGVVPISVRSVAGYFEQLHLPVDSRRVPDGQKAFVEAAGTVSIEAGAAHLDASLAKVYRQLPKLGRVERGSVTLQLTANPEAAPYLEYPIYLFSEPKTVSVTLYFTTVLEVRPDTPIKYDIAFDGAENTGVQLLDSPGRGDLPKGWADAVMNGVWTRQHDFTLTGDLSGPHVVRYRPLSNELNLEKIVVDAGGLQASYLGPPASSFVGGQSHA